MKYLRDQRGNSFFYLLWLLSIVFIMLVIVLNIAKAYVVKQQADTAVEQAAIAGTRDLITLTEDAINAFDENPLESANQKLVDHKTIAQQVEEKKQEYHNDPEAEAYIKALNAVLPSKIEKYPFLKNEFTQRMGSMSAIRDSVWQSVAQIIEDNHGNSNDPEPEIDLTEDCRLEVKATVTYESISDQKIIAKFFNKIAQKGYGASLIYLKNVLNE